MRVVLFYLAVLFATMALPCMCLAPWPVNLAADGVEAIAWLTIAGLLLAAEREQRP